MGQSDTSAKEGDFFHCGSTGKIRAICLVKINVLPSIYPVFPWVFTSIYIFCGCVVLIETLFNEHIYIYIISYHIMTYIRHLPPLCCILSPSYMESTTVIGLLALLDNKVLIQTGPLSNLWQPPVETLTCMHPYGCWRHFVYVELLFQGRILAVGCRSARKFAFNVSCCRPLRPYWSP